MRRINVYIVEAFNDRLKILAPKFNSALKLLEFSKLAEKLPSKPGVPTDISTNHNYYAWGGEKNG